MVLLIWAAWVIKKKDTTADPANYRDRGLNEDTIESPVSVKGRDFQFNYSLTFKDSCMKKVIESLRLNEVVSVIKEWLKRNRRNDDDRFDHPFAIF